MIRNKDFDKVAEWTKSCIDFIDIVVTTQGNFIYQENKTTL